MSNSITQHVNTLIEQRAAYQAKQFASAPAAPTTDHTVSLFGGLLKYTIPLPQPPAPVVDTSALATRSRIDELNSVIAGQSTELAQLRQAVLVLAKSSKAVETGIDTVVTDMQVVKQQTATKIIPWSKIKKDLTRAWDEILEETMFIQEDVNANTSFKVLRQFFGAGTGASDAIKATKREVFSYLKTVRSARLRIEQNYEYALLHYSSEIGELIPSLTPLTVGTNLTNVPGLKEAHKFETWTILDILKSGFLTALQKKLYAIRGI